MAKGWTCRRISQGVKCGEWNAPRTRKCRRCGKARPKKRQPAHMKALDLSYEEYVLLNGGEFCGICGAPTPTDRKLDRDHAHVGNGIARGLLCRDCNRKLRRVLTAEWLRRAADYLERAQDF